MASEDEASRRDGGASAEELAHYKSQYEQLEVELQEFQASSRELEAELERDIEASEKRERQLKEKVESLGFEVDEWKTKCKQSKIEANNAQNSLQKEVTTLRDSNRAMQLKLRDIEVANDDFERQARHTTSSLEDVESKYNVAIERGVMLEEEIKVGEKEREGLRIESQRLKDELSDLRIEAEIVQEKLKLAESTIARHHGQKAKTIPVEGIRARSPLSEASTSATTLSSPTASTPPPTRSDVSASASATPPSPPLSETSPNIKRTPLPVATRKRSMILDNNATPRPVQYRTQHTRGPSIPMATAGRSTPSFSRQLPPSSRTALSQESGPARSGSLHQIRGLIGKMQKLEARVQSARSKLPAPTHTPPRASPRSGSAMGTHIPASVTVRSNRKRSSNATTSIYGTEATTPTPSSHSRLSFGRPSTSGPGLSSNSRPSSRASAASGTGYARPSSRSSMSGARTPLGGHYEGTTIRRPRSSMSGSYGHGHGHSASISETDSRTGSVNSGLSTPSARRKTLEKGLTGIPTPSGLPRRQSGGLGRQSLGGMTEGEMLPPERRRKLSEVGETY